MSLRNVISALICLIVPFSGYSQIPSGILLTYDDNKTAIFSFDDNPKIIFSKNGATVKSTRSSISISYENLRTIEYVSVAGIDEVESLSHFFQIRGTELFLSSKFNTTLKIYDIKGIQIENRTIAEDETISIILKPGFYIVCINNQTIKIQVG